MTPNDLAAVSFLIEGAAVAKQSTRFTGRGCYRDPRVTAWEESVGWAARAAMGAREPFAGDVDVTIRFYLPNRRRADIDNLTKAVLDGSKTILFADDCQVVKLTAEKHIDHEQPRVYVTVTTLPQLEAPR